MKTRIYQNCTVTIENAQTKKTLWLEESVDSCGIVVAYAVKKRIEPKIIINNKPISKF